MAPRYCLQIRTLTDTQRCLSGRKPIVKGCNEAWQRMAEVDQTQISPLQTSRSLNGFCKIRRHERVAHERPAALNARKKVPHFYLHLHKVGGYNLGRNRCLENALKKF